MSELREALRYAREALPAANERETVICAIEGTHLRALVDALSAEPAQEITGWKCGNEFAPYHPDASHVPPEYRDGWNACYRAASKFVAADRASRLPEMGEGDWPELPEPAIGLPWRINAKDGSVHSAAYTGNQVLAAMVAAVEKYKALVRRKA